MNPSEQSQNNSSCRPRKVFVAGATGYMGVRLAEQLILKGQSVLGLARSGSEKRLPKNCKPVLGNALDRTSFIDKLDGADTYVQLVGIAHPSPTKGPQFRAIDLKSCEESVAVAMANRIQHFVYVSVAHPAPMMKSYIEVRTQCEAMIQQSGMNTTILRPWYVLGPGHYWPYLLKPGYWLARQIPSMKESAIRLGLVTLPQMIAALVLAVESPASGVRIVEAPQITKGAVGG
jgi:uncharacterized protein YbjT (DUF2867 family)